MTERAVIYRPPQSGTTLKIATGQYLVDKATGEETAGTYTLYEVTSMSNAGPKLHRHDWEEAFYVLEGLYEFSYIGDNGEVQRMTAEPGAVVIIPAGQWHAFKNARTGRSRMLSLNQPVGLEPFFRHVGRVCDPEATETRSEPISGTAYERALVDFGIEEYDPAKHSDNKGG